MNSLLELVDVVLEDEAPSDVLDVAVEPPEDVDEVETSVESVTDAERRVVLDDDVLVVVAPLYSDVETVAESEALRIVAKM